MTALRGFPRSCALWVTAGTAAITAGLLPHTTLLLPWPVRLAIGASGAVACAASLPAAWRWVMNGDEKEAP